MTLDADDLAKLADHACAAAREAGEYIASTRPRDVRKKQAGQTLASELVTEVDHRAQQMILRHLAPTTAAFDLGLLSEEVADNKTRLHKPYFWSIDPLDGTLPFVEGRPGYAVSIALVSQTGIPVVGVVFDPHQQTLFRAIKGYGIDTSHCRWQPPATSDRLSIYLDRSAKNVAAYQNLCEAVADATACKEVRVHYGAGAVMNACEVLAHPPACYFKLPKPSPGGGSLWDFAATACLFSQAGAVASDIHGHALDLNRKDSLFMNHRGVVFATDPQIAAALTAGYQQRRG